jgi:hypothetical protein
MSCRDDGFIQAYIDGECSGEEARAFAAHLLQCGDCQQRFEQLLELETWTSEQVQAGMPAKVKGVPIDTKEAWQTFQLKLRASRPSPVPSSGVLWPDQTKRSWKNVNKSVKHWVAGASAAAILLGALTFPQVQAAANQFLSIFRMDKVEFVKLTQEDFQEVERWLQSGEAGEMELKGLGRLWIDEGGLREPQSFDSVEKAVKAGHEVPKLPSEWRVEYIEAIPRFTLNLELNTEKANKLLAQLKVDTRFDEKLNGKQFSLEVPKAIRMQLKNGDTHLDYNVVEAPKLTAPEGVDVGELRSTILALPFIPENVKQQLIDIDDWQHTLPMPFLADGQNSAKEIQLNGAKALLTEEEYRTSVIWQRDGHIHMLNGYGTKADQVLAVAKQLK